MLVPLMDFMAIGLVRARYGTFHTILLPKKKGLIPKIAREILFFVAWLVPSQAQTPPQMAINLNGVRDDIKSSGKFAIFSYLKIEG